jgi:hypothetical protein
MKDKGRKPDFILGGLVKGDTRDESRINNNMGAAWIHDDGTIRIKLSPFVQLDGSFPDVVLTLFPNIDKN